MTQSVISEAVVMLTKNSDDKYVHNFGHFEQMEQLAHSLVQLIKTHYQVPCVAIHEEEREFLRKKFEGLPYATREARLEKFQRYVDFCNEMVESGISLKDKKAALRSFLGKYSLSAPSLERIYKILDKNTYVEIYNKDSVQVYRSLDFLNVTNHSLMALETCEFWELFHRSSAINEKVLDIVNGINTGSILDPVFLPVEKHTVKEIRSVDPRSSQTRMTLLAPLHLEGDEKSFQGFIHFFKVTSAYSLKFEVVN